MDETAAAPTLAEAASSFDPASARAFEHDAEEQRQETLRRYPREHWPEMLLEEYAQGQADHPDNLCRWIERQTDDMGSIRGGSARKLIVYKRANQPGWHYPPGYTDEQQAWHAVRAGFVDAFDLADQGRWDEIDRIGALLPGPALVTKVVWVYFPGQLLPITSRDNLRHFLRVAGEDAIAANSALGAVALNRALLESLCRVPELEGVSTKALERFLYTRFSPFEGRLIKIAPGENAKFWEDCLAGGYICVGWDDVGDLTQFDSKEAFLAAFREHYSDLYNNSASKLAEKANELWTLAEIGAGERIVANRGTSHVLALGTVQPPGYVWDDSRPEFKHTVLAQWDPSFAKDIAPQGRWAFKTVLTLTGKARDLVLGDDASEPEQPPAGEVSAAEPIFVAIAESLERRGQAVLYGPPGTGKTWTVQRFARWWLRRKNGNVGSRVSAEPGHRQTWWVAVNPDEWRWDVLFENGEEVFRRGRPQRNYDQIAEGDLVIGYTSTPVKRIEALARVKRLEQIEDGRTFVLEPLGRVTDGPEWEELHGDPALAESQPIVSNSQGTLFALTQAESDHLLGLIAARDPAAVNVIADAGGDASDGRHDRSESVEALEWITFHPSYSYEDFVEGFRPAPGAIGTQLRLELGIFKTLCQRAQADPARTFLLVIDEINRANIAKAFGELITLMERDKRGKIHARLPYSKELFTIPPNVYVLGTMNTADRSIKLLDTALRRRFGFVELMPDPDLLAGATVEGVALDDLLRELNRRIAKSAGREKQIGHSFFLKDEQPLSDATEFAQVFRSEIVPLLQEYAYDDYEDLADYLGERIVDRDALALNQTVLADPTLLLDALEEHLIGSSPQEP